MEQSKLRSSYSWPSGEFEQLSFHYKFCVGDNLHRMYIRRTSRLDTISLLTHFGFFFHISSSIAHFFSSPTCIKRCRICTFCNPLLKSLRCAFSGMTSLASSFLFPSPRFRKNQPLLWIQIGQVTQLHSFPCEGKRRIWHKILFLSWSCCCCLLSVFPPRNIQQVGDTFI